VKVSIGATGVLAIGGLIALGLVAWKVAKGAGQAGQWVGQVAHNVDPTDPTNIVNRAVSAVGESLTSPTSSGRNGDGSWSLGGWLYDVTHGGAIDYTKSTNPTLTPGVDHFDTMGNFIGNW